MEKLLDRRSCKRFSDVLQDTNRLFFGSPARSIAGVKPFLSADEVGLPSELAGLLEGVPLRGGLALVGRLREAKKVLLRDDVVRRWSRSHNPFSRVGAAAPCISQWKDGHATENLP